MTEEERRRAQRRDGTFSATILTTESVEIVGETINLSRGGVLVRAHRRISVLLHFKGKQYRGRLVRVSARGPDTTEYAVELEDLIELDADQP